MRLQAVSVVVDKFEQIYKNIGSVVSSTYIVQRCGKQGGICNPNNDLDLDFSILRMLIIIKALIVYFTRDSKHWEKKNLLLSFHQTQIDITRFRYLTD
jgi:hypothetical protein